MAMANWQSKLVPAPLRKSVRTVRMLWATGALRRPGELVDRWRHRDAFKQIEKALFYHRYAAAFMLGHELGIYDQLYAGGKRIDEIAEACGIHPRAAEALLRILTGEELLVRIGDEYQLSEFGRLYMAREGRLSLADSFDLMAAQALAFAELESGMKTGQVPAALDIFSADGRYQAFLNAVNTFLYYAGADLLQRIELPEIRSFILGSMGVSFSSLLLDRCPDATVTYGCLEHLVREVPRLRDQYNVPAERVAGSHSHSGDPTADRWGNEDFDLVFLTKKMILEPETRMGERFAAKAFDVLNPGGIAIFWETLHTDDRPTPLARAMEAVLDLGASPVGLVNTETSITAMLDNIGYRDIEIVPCLDNSTTFVVGRKPR